MAGMREITELAGKSTLNQMERVPRGSESELQGKNP